MGGDRGGDLSPISLGLAVGLSSADRADIRKVGFSVTPQVKGQELGLLYLELLALFTHS